ncbi:pseudouridine synthase [Xanthomonas campestris pv. campestris]|uniref:pseudouridine synthase n=1 Tax=Xanthomonas campestris TaxID=339 RepID=UPI0015F25503|nr:pseudouridine synthase [Xanthomonas campestris]MDM7673020.1 pseudouridine synthase [Xanthomonas campestris pv. campestris]MDM7677960.1 pseudouridine synthase [Xanthomonas campestris pv. campestris]MDM7700103.1 pseudouridine synthase [Xanthomonas campestris pv. campestris]MDM7721506.1 pseudouridine synthase [Xanthomonas campestris pv. campestris]MEA0967604.1 pseudouridine synthase [Xanthomonas campestris pv. campestris]
MSDTPRKLSLNKLSLKRDSAPEAPKLEERLHKVLAQAGLGSRRALEQRIADGLIKVNGAVAQTGMSVRSGDKIELDGRSFVASALTESSRVLVYNKPEGEVTTREDPEGRPTVFESLPALKGSRWIAIGRLDINTTGLLLLTTDGELANAMMHPSYEVEREYVVRVRAPEGEEKVPDSMIERLSRGVLLEDGGAKFDEIERIGGTDSHDWFRVVVKEGRNREVRRLWESQGCQVSRLKRTRYGKVSLPRELLRGQSVELAQEKVDALRAELKLEEGAPSALTLQPVIGQRRAAKSTVHVSRDGRSNAYVNGQTSGADEGRELRRFDNLREDRGGRGGRGKPGGFKGGLTVSGEAAAKQSQQRPFKQRGPAKGDRSLPDGNPAAFRSWYVPDGVSTGPSGHRNAGPGGAGTGQPRPYAKKGPGGARPGAGGQGRGAAGGQGQSQGQSQGQRKHPYGHPGNAPSFPSDHANPGFSPYGAARPATGRPTGARPGGNRGPNANRGPGGPGGAARGPGGPGGAPRGGPGGRPPGGGNRRPPGGGNRGR